MKRTDIIRTTRLSGTFGATEAVTELPLSVPTGITFGFLGPNGAGKTTTMRLLLGVLEPSSGSAEVLGLDVARNGGEIRRNCGALIEEAGLYQRLTGLENLEFLGRLYRMSPEEIRVRSKELLGELGLWKRSTEGVGGWSKGMKQKLAVARALLPRPALPFLDEPTAGLDVASAARLRDELSRMV